MSSHCWNKLLLKVGCMPSSRRTTKWTLGNLWWFSVSSCCIRAFFQPSRSFVYILWFLVLCLYGIPMFVNMYVSVYMSFLCWRGWTLPLSQLNLGFSSLKRGHCHLVQVNGATYAGMLINAFALTFCLSWGSSFSIFQILQCFFFGIFPSVYFLCPVLIGFF